MQVFADLSSGFLSSWTCH